MNHRNLCNINRNVTVYNIIVWDFDVLFNKIWTSDWNFLNWSWGSLYRLDLFCWNILNNFCNFSWWNPLFNLGLKLSIWQYSLRLNWQLQVFFFLISSFWRYINIWLLLSIGVFLKGSCLYFKRIPLRWDLSFINLSFLWTETDCLIFHISLCTT